LLNVAGGAVDVARQVELQGELRRRAQLPKPTHDFDRAAQGEGNPVSQYVPTG